MFVVMEFAFFHCCDGVHTDIPLLLAHSLFLSIDAKAVHAYTRAFFILFFLLNSSMTFVSIFSDLGFTQSILLRSSRLFHSLDQLQFPVDFTELGFFSFVFHAKLVTS